MSKSVAFFSKDFWFSPDEWGFRRLKSRQHLQSLPSQAENQLPKGDFADVGAVSNCRLPQI
jgi:hypothetical protein